MVVSIHVGEPREKGCYLGARIENAEAISRFICGGSIRQVSGMKLFVRKE